MDDEESFARLLSQSNTAQKPSWSPAATPDDPWANPFANEQSSNPYASSFPVASLPGPASPREPGQVDSPTSPKYEQSPYSLQTDQDSRAIVPDPPSVIAARLGEEERGFDDGQAYESPTRALRPADAFGGAESGETPTSPRARRGLPPGLVGDDFLGTNDPSSSLKKAFVKSSPAKTTKVLDKADQAAEPYVFTPSKKKATSDVPQANGHDGEKVKSEAEKETATSMPASAVPKPDDKLVEKNPMAIPLPESTDITPTVSRTDTPAPPPPPPAVAPAPGTGSTSLPTPASDRVSVSPLDAPSGEHDYGFKSLALGASASNTTLFNGDTSATSSRFGGRGWGAMDEDDASGLFGKGGPSTRVNDPWSGGDQGWGEPGLPSPQAGPSHLPSESSETPSQDDDDEMTETNGAVPPIPPKPTFSISVDDPTRVGDPVRGYTVYTVRTRTTSPHYRRSEFSVLRRFSDFLWLFDVLTANNPGVIVPPMPDKHPFGRFQDTFIETRRMALERCLSKITSHPVLVLDPDLRLFLESESFSVDSKARPPPSADKTGILASWTGPKYVEQDDWFESRKIFLDSLESQLRALSKSIELASKNRLEVANAMQDFATSMALLADSDLNTSMTSALGRLGDLAAREKVTNEELATAEVVNLLNLSDEYLRFINSVRLAFASRIKCFERWTEREKESSRLKGLREKARQQGRLGDQANQSLAQIGEAERKSRDAAAEFENVSRLVKSEFGRFERERILEFKRVMERHLELQVRKQKELITAWEEYHGMVLRMVQRSQGQAQ